MKSEVFLLDCMEGMKQYPDKYFDLAVVDPNYRDKNDPTKDMRKNGSMDSIVGRPTKEYWKQLKRISKEQIIWGANNFELQQWEGFIVWKKKTIGQDFTMSMCEIAAISKGLGTVSKFIEIAPQGTINDPRIHPTQKPVALYDWIYAKYLPQGGKVLDTHLGSGSNRIAADKAGNIEFTAFEIDKDYFEAQEERFRLYKSQLKLAI